MNKSKAESLRKRKAQNIKAHKKNPGVWLYPAGEERQYRRMLKSLVKELKLKIKDILIPEIPILIDEVQGKISSDRADDFMDRLKGLIIFIRSSIQNKLESTIRGAEAIGLEISGFNKRQSRKFNENVFGIDIFVSEPWLRDQLRIFSNQNAQLITSIVDDELERVAGIVERGLQQGQRFTETSKEIQKTFGINERRADLIARDQTQKLNSSLTMNRQREVGVEEYIWQTSGDERVRPTHKANDGKKFRWDTPPARTGHPGHDINCRCNAIAVLDKLLDFGD